MVQRASSPELTPSDFFVFAYLKQKLQGVHIPDREKLKSEIIRIFGKAGPDVLISVFEDPIKRLKWVVQNAGENRPQDTTCWRKTGSRPYQR
jgi:hypothetical protein